MNDQAGSADLGIPHPSACILNVQGKVVPKYLEEDHKERVSGLIFVVANSESPLRRVIKTKYRRIKATVSNDVARHSLRVALSVEIELKEGMLIYTPRELGTFGSVGRLVNATDQNVSRCPLQRSGS